MKLFERFLVQHTTLKHIPHQSNRNIWTSTTTVIQAKGSTQIPNKTCHFATRPRQSILTGYPRNQDAHFLTYKTLLVQQYVTVKIHLHEKTYTSTQMTLIKFQRYPEIQTGIGNTFTSGIKSRTWRNEFKTPRA